jgi:hypothetical protein
MIARWSVGADPLVIGRIDKETFGAESLERPALIRGADGGWRVYLSCATPGSKHWWIESLSGAHPEDLPDGLRRMEFPGDATTGVKDPVLRFDRSGVRAWVCCHPLDEPGEEDRMSTALAVQQVGSSAWEWQGTVLAGSAGRWDARGARVTAVVPGVGVSYDGRASKAANFAERTGLAVASNGGRLAAVGDGPVADVRYLDVLEVPGGGFRLFYEAPLADGSHDLRTEEHPGKV